MSCTTSSTFQLPRELEIVSTWEQGRRLVEWCCCLLLWVNIKEECEKFKTVRKRIHKPGENTISDETTFINNGVGAWVYVMRHTQRVDVFYWGSPDYWSVGRFSPGLLEVQCLKFQQGLHRPTPPGWQSLEVVIRPGMTESLITFSNRHGDEDILTGRDVNMTEECMEVALYVSNLWHLRGMGVDIRKGYSTRHLHMLNQSTDD